MKKKFVLGSILILTAAGVVLGFTLFRNDKNMTSLYKTETLERGQVESLVITTGTLNPVMQVDVGSQVSGIIKDIFVDFNSFVEKGQVLAKLDQSAFLTKLNQEKANYASAEASLEKARTILENLQKKNDRYAELFTKDLVSFEDMETIETQYFNAQSDLKSTEAKLSQAKSQLEASQVDLTYTVIKSPVDGVVIDRRVNVGQTVAASMQTPVLFQIAQDLSQMQVECSIDEADIGSVKEGQDVRFSVDAYPDESFVGTISQVRYSPVITQNVVTYTTIVDVANPDLNLLPGMTATVSIIVEQAKNVLLIPNAALRYSPQFSEKNPQRIWILDETSTLKSIIVKIGVTDNSYSELLEGMLTEGQVIVTGEDTTSTKTSSSNQSSSMNQMMRMMQ
ncbi:MAG: efflux RND transporter periplasmic adaptor subunit [Candidatus Aminicenantes bacterium]|nr:efflux RND transporter periplasmic adaptor subunit [Candidatus Aminicenantes bacterium]